MKNSLLIVMVATVLALSLWNAWDDSSINGEHHQFFEDQNKFSEDVKLFMQQTNDFKAIGPRNTGLMGMKLCERLNTIEMNESLPITNCHEIYNITKGE